MGFGHRLQGVSTFVSVVSRVMAPKNIHFVISEICDYAVLRGKRELHLQMELSWIIWVGPVLKIEEGDRREGWIDSM